MPPEDQSVGAVSRYAQPVSLRVWRVRVTWATFCDRSPGLDFYLRRVRAMHRVLGIPPAYCESGMSLCREATELVAVPGCGPKREERLMATSIKQRWLAMRAAAACSSITLTVKSSYRSLEDQALLLRDYLVTGQSIEQLLTSIAAPGYSQHHTGRALDIGTDEGDDDFESSAAFQWLKQNAHTYGFVLSYPRDNAAGIIYEPWHWYCREPDTASQQRV